MPPGGKILILLVAQTTDKYIYLPLQKYYVQGVTASRIKG